MWTQTNQWLFTTIFSKHAAVHLYTYINGIWIKITFISVARYVTLLFSSAFSTRRRSFCSCFLMVAKWFKTSAPEKMHEILPFKECKKYSQASSVCSFIKNIFFISIINPQTDKLHTIKLNLIKWLDRHLHKLFFHRYFKIHEICPYHIAWEFRISLFCFTHLTILNKSSCHGTLYSNKFISSPKYCVNFLHHVLFRGI